MQGWFYPIRLIYQINENKNLFILNKQECIQVGCVPLAVYHARDRDPPGQRPSMDRDFPWTKTPWTETLPNKGWDNPPPTCGQTDTYENITLPQTSFAGGKKIKLGSQFP